MAISFTAGLPPEFPFPTPDPRFQKPAYEAPPIPVIYETTEMENISLRVYAAIHLRVPDSGIDWVDKMIRRSRRLDSR